MLMMRRDLSLNANTAAELSLKSASFPCVDAYPSLCMVMWKETSYYVQTMSAYNDGGHEGSPEVKAKHHQHC